MDNNPFANAIQQMEENGWYHGDISVQNSVSPPRTCLWLAAVHDNAGSYGRAESDRIVAVLIKAIREEDPSFNGRGSQAIWDWNDAQTDFDVIKRVVDDAKALWEVAVAEASVH